MVASACTRPDGVKQTLSGTVALHRALQRCGLADRAVVCRGDATSIGHGLVAATNGLGVTVVWW